MSYKGFSDFRSDTVTRPTEEMRQAMYDAEVGDDVLGDDPTVIRLEESAAEITGKEAALFMPSGTMANTVALILCAGAGKEVILEDKSHILNFEAGNISRLAHALPRALPSDRGKIPLSLLEANIHTHLRDHVPETKAITLENTHNTWGGSVLEPDYLEQVSRLARKYNLHLHLDGARMFNAATALKTDIKEITRHFDTLMFCLSKGLCAPVGSILAGSKDFIKESRIVRKYLGGGMRQVGVLAAAGIVAVEKMPLRLEEDHALAKKLAVMLSDIPGLEINADEIVTNFLMLNLKNMDAALFLKRLAEYNVLALPFNSRLVRMVTHKDIDLNDVEIAAKAVREILTTGGKEV